MLYRSYMFRTKDPIIDELRTMLEKANGDRITRKELKHIEENGGPKVGTTSAWFFGKVQRPQNATIEATGRASGYRRVWVKQRENSQWLEKKPKTATKAQWMGKRVREKA
jgi:hypothetical protein